MNMALMPVEDALSRILAGTKLSPAQYVKLDQSAGRVLAADIIAKRDQPPFHASAMDGYALRHADLATPLKLVGVSAAGHAYKGSLKAGQAVRILTGAPLPQNADTIVIQENCSLDGNLLTIISPPDLGRNIRPTGLDFRAGDVLIPAGTILNARDIGLAAAGNAAMLRVRKKPRLVLFATGDELVLPGTRPRADQIVSSNSHALSAMARLWGADVINLGIVADTMKATKAAIRKAFDADILITTGGASVGDHDYVKDAFTSCGIKIDFWKIALRPGKPMLFGTRGTLKVLGLPGNPVSALVCARIFLKPLIDLMLGVTSDAVPAFARLAALLPANDGRQDYIRAKLTNGPDGTRTVEVSGKQDSSLQRNLRNADCLIVREPHAPEAMAGSLVPVILLDF